MPSFLADKGLRILRNGYNVIPIKPGDKAPSIRAWQTLETTESDVNRWKSNGRANHGIGITTGTTPLVDIDIFDTEMNRYMVDFTETVAGFAPVRVGFEPKRGMLYRSPTPFRKVTSTAFNDPEGRKAQIEILGEGEQFVAFHIHPDTHKPYRWLGSENPEVTPASELPILTRDHAQMIVTEFERRATELGWQRRRNKPNLPALVHDPDDPFGIGTEPLGLTDDELRDHVMLIPNEGVEADYDYWLNIGMAIHHETGGSEFGRDLFYEWSDQNTVHNDADFTKKWDSFGKYEEGRRLVTARLIIKLSKEFKQAAIAETIGDLIRRMELATGINELKDIAADCRKVDADIIDRSRLINTLQKAVKDKTHTPLGIREAREMVRYRPADGAAPEWLDGWCYLKHAKQFYHHETGERIEREAFDAAFGRFVGTETTASRYALETVKIPVFHMTVFLPNEEERFTDTNGLNWINTYSEKSLPSLPTELTRKDLRNVETVEQHFYHMFTDEREIELFISWLAYIVQARMRPNWAIVLQGCEASGKTYFAQLMAAVLGGSHIYILGTDTLQTSNFTSWAEGHQLIFIEELKLHGHNRYDILNKLKPYITNTSIEIHPKRISPYNVPNTTAYLAATNFRDALPLFESDSRYFILMSRWQSKFELDAFKLENPAYYPNLFTAIQDSPGAIRKWLLEYKLHADFNPVDRAPPSHGKSAMIEEAKSDEQAMIEDFITDKMHPLVSNEILITSFLRELIAGETGDLSGPIGTAIGFRRLMESMGFAFCQRIRIGTDRYSCWSKDQSVIGASYNDLKNLVSGRLDDSQPL